MSRRLNVKPNMARALQNAAGRNVRPKPVLRNGGRPLPVKKVGGCGCGK